MKSIWVRFAQLGARYFPNWLKAAIYRNPWFANYVRQRINRSVPDGITTVKVAGGRLKGLSLCLDLQKEKDYWLGTYELGLQNALGELVRPGMVAYDIGANIGYITLLLARLVGEDGAVYAFEALPTNLERLEANIALNQIDAKIVVVSSAVLDHSGDVEFLVSTSGGMGKAVGSAGRQNIEYNNRITLSAISVDDFVYSGGYPVPQLVKMDIEGGEVQALPGMRRLLLESRPLLMLELHGYDAARIAWDVLGEAGYRLCYMERNFPKVTVLEELEWKSYVVAFPDHPEIWADNQ